MAECVGFERGFQSECVTLTKRGPLTVIKGGREQRPGGAVIHVANVPGIEKCSIHSSLLKSPRIPGASHPSPALSESGGKKG